MLWFNSIEKSLINLYISSGLFLKWYFEAKEDSRFSYLQSESLVNTNLNIYKEKLYSVNIN